ncbi:MAG: GTPase Era [bacterium]|nr:GTPase Era [bacterium]
MKAGVVVMLGRTNAGKSTLLNRLIGQKVAITSRKPQTTRFSINAVYEEERGQIVFTDTPGVFEKSPDLLAKKVGLKPEETLKEGVNVAVYVVDHTRYRDVEENRTLGMVRKLDVPKILVFNKWDIKKPSFYEELRFMEEEFDTTLFISALKGHNLNLLLEEVFKYLPEVQSKLVDTSQMVTPLLNVDSKLYIEEIIREKAFHSLGQELPYTLTVTASEITERENGTLYIRADIVTNEERYKKMIIGSDGKKIKQIGLTARKELETARNQKVYIELKVVVNRHWMETF